MYKELIANQKAAYEKIIAHIGWGLDSLKGYNNLDDYHQGMWSEKQAYCVENGLLTGLRLKQTAFKDTNCLKDLHALVDLNLEECLVEDITALSFTKNLKSINLAFNEIKSLDLLNELALLEKINIKGCRFDKIPTLKNLDKLTWLNLEYNNIEAINKLENLNHLKYLNISNNKINELDGLQNLGELEELWISYNNIKSLAPLSKNKNLKQIIASNNYHISGFEELATLNNLEHISISDSLLKTLNGIGALTQLKELDVQSNELTSLGEIVNLNNLQSLNLNMNSISSITNFPVDGFERLEHFYISQNKLNEKANNLAIIDQLKSKIPNTSFGI